MKMKELDRVVEGRTASRDVQSSRSTLEDPDRGKWGSKTEFILSCLGYAIGIGNVWRFPYLCYRNGGGAFLVPYLLMLVLCGIPLFFMETTLGQFASTGCITLFRICPLLKGTGFAIVIVNIICTMYYNVIISYPIYFLVMSLRSKLPWEDCNHEWNTDKCLKLGTKMDETDNNTQTSSGDLTNFSTVWKTPADEFFHHKILQISDGIDSPGTVVWELLLCDMVSWIVIFLCIKNGVKSVGKVVYFTATFPFAILFVLFVRGVTLPGAWEGIRFYISPQWDQLLNIKVWADAAVQIFYSLGPGWGGIVNMASYNRFHNNNKWDSIFVPMVNCGTSIFAGFVVFSVLGFMSHKTGIPVATVATGGPGLAFVTYPEAITMLPLPQLWAVLFFFMLYLLGMDSLFVQIEAIISSVTDAYPKLRKHKQHVTAMSCFVMFLGSLSCVTNGGMYVLQLLDWYAASISVIFICIVEVVIVGWIYGCSNFIRDLEFMTQEKVHVWWKMSWKYVTPTILVFIFMTTVAFNSPVTYNGKRYPEWAHALGWIAALASMICIPIGIILMLAISRGTLYQRLKKNLWPSSSWGPAVEEDHAAWKSHIAKCTTDDCTSTLSFSHPLPCRLKH
ncbi:sodium- and chloride-dependent glycine transporter 1-like isoform X2 [Zootermopsis nevadensis]|uniref:sodium- and chloride-dependent glycine transporter 1-like isoform X2 n=1 Tax=Zootermopsis nevadensis TaxID=136037 RepID=UPI000B8E6DFD|nr:sodium- and chloride-dependent glycine transporter 1-like isoform X2 [Zootermopsis nevadensis]